VQWSVSVNVNPLQSLEQLYHAAAGGGGDVIYGKCLDVKRVN